MSVIDKLNKFYGIQELDETSLAYISQFECNGEYNLDEGEDLSDVPFDARCDLHWMGKYHVVKLLLDYYNKGHEEVCEQFIRCFRACIKNKFELEGFLGDVSGMDLLRTLMENGLLKVIRKDVRSRLMLASYIGDQRSYREDDDTYYSSSVKLIKLYDTNNVFVYGTLMRGQINHDYLEDDAYIGNAVLENYGLLELGGFPGAVPMEGLKVYGELYSVTDNGKKRIDALEGSLYKYKKALFRSGGKLYYAGFYEYIETEEDESAEISGQAGKWNGRAVDPANYVWYVCYGASMCCDRFMKYIRKTTEKEEPICSETIEISHPVYYDSRSKIWKGAKLFLDVNADGRSYGVKYLITRKQYDEISKMEGPDYDLKFCLGTDNSRIPMYTFTTSKSFDTDYEMSESYLSVLRKGLEEHYGESEEILRYLRSIPAKRPSDPM
ncbi:MAG: gamma-glutamylcyclotransferase [Solobacterium sp.]|nr:gamma-glutamylcyclotransferase [Solobacterium sp.]